MYDEIVTGIHSHFTFSLFQILFAILVIDIYSIMNDQILQSFQLAIVLSTINNLPIAEAEHSFHFLPASSGNMILCYMLPATAAKVRTFFCEF
jgi:hypothetical protein